MGDIFGAVVFDPKAFVVLIFPTKIVDDGVDTGVVHNSSCCGV